MMAVQQEWNCEHFLILGIASLEILGGGGVWWVWLGGDVWDKIDDSGFLRLFEGEILGWKF